jgi:hypothetical protein
MRKLIATIAFLLLAAAPAARAQGVPLIPIVAGPAASGVVLKAVYGELVSAYAVCTAACWLMIFNSPTIPAGGATTPGNAPGNLVSCIPIGAGGLGSVSYAPGPFEAFTTGISVAISSTSCATLTPSSTAFIHGLVR